MTDGARATADHQSAGATAAGQGDANGEVGRTDVGTVTARVPGLPFYCVAGLIVSVEVARFTLAADRMVLDTAELVVIVAIGTAYALLGHRIATRVPPTRAARIAGLSVLFAVAGALLSGVTVAFGRLAGDPVFEEAFLIIFGGSLTAVVGLGVGYYALQFRAQYEDLERQVHRTERLSKELSITHRVLRHNLRNELTVIEGHTDMARTASGSDPSSVEAHLDVVAEHLDDVEAICEKAADLAKITPDTDRRRLDAVTELETAIQRVSDRFPTADLTVSTPETAPVLAHPRLRTVFEELLENALEHNDPATVEVTAAIEPPTGPDDTTRIQVSDTGSGIPEMEVMNLRQAEEEPLSHGQGLGLWVVYTVIEQSGGYVTFEPNTPSGTVVVVDLEPAENVEQ